MRTAMWLVMIGVVAALPGKVQAQEQLYNIGERFVKVLNVENLKGDDLVRIKVRLYYWEPWFEKKLIGQGRMGRLQISKYLLKWGQELKWEDGTVQLRSMPAAVIRYLPAPEWDSHTEGWKPGPLLGKDKKDKKPGLPGAVEDIQKGSWITVNLQRRNSTGGLFADRVIIHRGYDKVIGKLPGVAGGNSNP